MMGEQRLVGGDDMLAGAECGLDGVLRHAPLAAHQFDEDVDAGVLRERDRILHAAEGRDVDVRVPAMLERRHGNDLNGPTGACGD